MKKIDKNPSRSSRRLELHRETLRRLQNIELQNANGGEDDSLRVSRVGTPCDY